MIEIQNLYKSFDGLPVLQGLSLTVARGDLVALVGRSGYGKTVFLKLITGLLRPESGQVLIDGQDISELSGRALSRLRRRLGFLFQGGALFETLTVFDNVAFPLREMTDMARSEIQKKVLYELDQVGLIDAKDKYPAQLSGGMRKRAALARELVLQPEIMIFDEPTTGLDPVSCNAILKLIRGIHERLHFTGIIATHEIPKVFDIVNKVAIIREGVIMAVGTPKEITTSKDPLVESFIQGLVEEPLA